MGLLEIAGETRSAARRRGWRREGEVGTRSAIGRGRAGNLVPERSFTYIRAHACARACENELPGEVIHCSAETNACVRAHACVYEVRPRFRDPLARVARGGQS